MIACYVGGAISDPKAMLVYKNINAGLELTARLINLGYAVFSPYSDYTYIMRTDCDIEDVYKYSIEMLKRCDCMIVVTDTDYKHSHGLAEEIKVCVECGIPIFYNLEDLAKFRRTKIEEKQRVI
jgi:nucleoside 2-deoxyribosyltransferase